jgi:predicted GNAT family N-acyltransferase
MPVTIISVKHPLYTQVLELRDRILRQPIGLSIAHDDISDEVNQVIFVATDEETLQGCVLMKQIDAQTVKLRQMAVDTHLQGKNIGKMLLEAAELYAHQRGIKKMDLHARKYAEGFYLKCGYNSQGDEFVEVGIPHVFMSKHL